MNFDTERLIFRPWREDDAEELYRYASDPDVGPAAGWTVHTSVENSREIIKNVLSAEDTYALVLKETGLPVGSLGIMRNSNHAAENEAEIGFWIGKPLWGRGLMPEAVEEALRLCFEELGFARVWCCYYEGNEKSRRVQEKCGFVFARRVENSLCSMLNELRTEIVNVIDRETWEKRRKL